MRQRMLVSLCVILMASMASLAIGHEGHGDAADSSKTTVQGELIDMNCYVAGQAKGQKHAKCAAKCMKSGIPAGILVEGKAFTLLTNPAPLAPYAAKTIRVTGTVDKDTQTVLPDKIEVKDGDQWKQVEMHDAHHHGDEDKSKDKDKDD